MKRFCYYFLQWTWGLPQNLLGLALWLLCPGEKAPCFHGAAVKRWKLRGCAGVGMFLFLSQGAPRRILVHEYGHSLQSVLLGPLFLPVIGLPSLLWAGLPAAGRYRRRRGRSYDWFYPERWANRLGSRVTGEDAGEKEEIRV